MPNTRDNQLLREAYKEIRPGVVVWIDDEVEEEEVSESKDRQSVIVIVNYSYTTDTRPVVRFYKPFNVNTHAPDKVSALSRIFTNTDGRAVCIHNSTGIKIYFAPSDQSSINKVSGDFYFVRGDYLKTSRVGKLALKHANEPLKKWGAADGAIPFITILDNLKANKSRTISTAR